MWNSDKVYYLSILRSFLRVRQYSNHTKHLSKRSSWRYKCHYSILCDSFLHNAITKITCGASSSLTTRMKYNMSHGTNCIDSSTTRNLRTRMKMHTQVKFDNENWWKQLYFNRGLRHFSYYISCTWEYRWYHNGLMINDQHFGSTMDQQICYRVDGCVFWYLFLERLNMSENASKYPDMHSGSPTRW